MKKHWTTTDIPSQAGRLAIVTGGNVGIGFCVGLVLGGGGGGVFLGCRDMAMGTAGVKRMKETLGGKGEVEAMGLDLASLESVRRFAEGVAGRGERVDVLVNNAGVMAVPTRRLTADGFELQFGTNHLGHFAFTGLLMPVLLKGERGRVVTVSSIAHKSGRMEMDNLNGERRYKDLAAYNNSKLANLMFALELDRRAGAAGLSLMSMAAHPGVATTNLFGAGSRLGGKQPLFSWLTEKFVPLLGHASERGALPILYAATAEGVKGGEYFGPDGWFEFKGWPRVCADIGGGAG